mgnify:CR=1 FL=1
MGMGQRTRSQQDNLFIPTASLARSSSHDFYERLNQVLAADGFDDFVEALCKPFYVEGKGRRSIPPGTYFRMLLVGYFEGLDSERGIDDAVERIRLTCTEGATMALKAAGNGTVLAGTGSPDMIIETDEVTGSFDLEVAFADVGTISVVGGATQGSGFVGCKEIVDLIFA